MPRTFETGEVSSVLDAARAEPHASGMAPFDSLLAASQTSGRGRYRRPWSSPPGNVYAALRLPMEDPFLGTEAAVALGAWLASALRAEGYPCLLKWPNDVVLQGPDGGPRKVCGILLEERGGTLLAGVGVNVASYPSESEMREGRALPAWSLGAYRKLRGEPVPEPGALWRSLATAVFSSYSGKTAPREAGGWLEAAGRLLLWRGERVVWSDGGRREAGVLEGVGPRGELLLAAPGGTQKFLSGGVCLQGPPERRAGWPSRPSTTSGTI